MHPLYDIRRLGRYHNGVSLLYPLEADWTPRQGREPSMHTRGCTGTLRLTQSCDIAGVSAPWGAENTWYHLIEGLEPLRFPRSTYHSPQHYKSSPISKATPTRSENH